jgi:hypothetical protein
VYADTLRPDVRMAYIDYEDVLECVAIAYVEQRLVRGPFEGRVPWSATPLR